MNRIWSSISIKICAQYIISIYYWDTTTRQLKDGRSLMREKKTNFARVSRAFYWTSHVPHVYFTCPARVFYKTLLQNTHVRFTGLTRTASTCVLLDSARRAREFPIFLHLFPVLVLITSSNSLRWIFDFLFELTRRSRWSLSMILNNLHPPQLRKTAWLLQ